MKEILHVKCVDFTFDGQGLAKAGSRVVFVPSLLIDEEADVEILYHKKDFDVGKIVKITKFSPYRIKSKCPCATSCGGCSFQNLIYSKELEYKKSRALQTINKIGGFNFKDAPVFGMDEPYYYRNKIQVPFGYDKQKRLVYGFYKFKSHDIVPITECAIESIEHVEILKTIKELMLSMKIEAYNEDTFKGDIRHVLIRVGKVTKEVMVVLVVKDARFKSRNNFVKALVKACNNITTVVINENPRKTNVILGEKEEVAYGPGFIYDYLLGVKFKISSKSFYQVNHDQCEKLYSLAVEEANLKPSDTILDAYCGIGTIGLIASKKVNKVYGVEIVKEAIIDAKNNARINKITNCYYECKDASDYVVENKFDCVFVDPPRKGLDTNFINSLLKSKPERIVYISCDVGTLSRDLSILKKEYNVNSVKFVDMFPRTYHIETVCSLTLKK